MREVRAGRARVRTAAIWVAGVACTLIGISDSPMLLVLAMWFLGRLARAPLRRLVSRLPPWLAFAAPGFVFGLLTETFAIWNNLALPPEKRVLMSPDPARDLAFGVLYYSMLIGAWSVLLVRYAFTKRELFVTAGVYGVMVEEVGQVFVRIFTVPGIGLLYALMVACIYGIFPLLAYEVGEVRLATLPRRRTRWMHPLAAGALAAEWLAFGILVLPAARWLAG